MNGWRLARRTFIAGAGALAGGLAVGFYYVRRPYPNLLAEYADEGHAVFNPYVAIGADESIIVVVPRAEMGQGVQTTLATLAAEELEVGLDRIQVTHGLASSVYYNNAVLEDAAMFFPYDQRLVARLARRSMAPVAKLFGMQVTGGSSSTRDAFVKMRAAAVSARQLLIEAAAREWELPPERLLALNGEVGDPQSGKSASYGQLAAKAALLPSPSSPRLKDRRQWKLLGEPQRRVDIPAKTTGAPLFGIDIDLPGMLFGALRLAPNSGAKLARMDASAALAIPGVEKVVELQSSYGSAIGVLARNSWTAFKGADALAIEWQNPAGNFDTASLFARLRDRLAEPADFTLRSDGNASAAIASASDGELLTAEYSAPFLAHACMEPMNATALFKDGVLDIWSPGQTPTLVQMAAAPLVGLRPHEIRVHTPYLGGGFGRRAETDFAVFAVQMASEAEGVPVKLLWSRQNDIRHDCYRPAAVAKMRARIRPRELPLALDISIASQSVSRGFLQRQFSFPVPSLPDRLVTEGAHDQPYRIENFRVAGHVAELPVAAGFWRSVGYSCNTFFLESFLDEIAHATGVDPLGMRLRLLAEHPSAIAVLQRVSEMSGWGRDIPAGHGFGLAHAVSFGTWVAQVVEVSVQDGAIAIEKVWCAADIGQALDPEIVRAQLMSGIIFGLSSAMNQQITFTDGAADQSNLNDFPIMRFDQCPDIEISVLETHQNIGGAGEPGVPPSIPALGNAIFAATGRRLRRLPFSSEIPFI